MLPSEWTLRHRRLSPEASAKKGGRFNFHEAPWQPEMMDCTVEPDVAGVVCMLCSQTSGKTETINNLVGYTIDIDPCPVLVVQPSLTMGTSWSKIRLTPMLRDSPRLRGKVKDPRKRDGGNTILEKRFPGGNITIAGAESPASLASRPIRKLFLDETDRYPHSAGKEGDPIALADKRTESFPDAIKIEVSTPTIKKHSRIEASFELTDKRYWHIACPQCRPPGIPDSELFSPIGPHASVQHLKWCQVDWSDRGTLEDPVYICENKACKAALTNDQLQTAIRAGRWIPTAPFRGTRGYHLNGIYTLFKPKRIYKTRLQQAVDKFLEAKRLGPEKLKVWTNTFLAETWEDEAESVEAAPLLKRCEPYGGADKANPILPPGVIVVTAAADVQRDRIEVETVGWGFDDESWRIEKVQIFGDPKLPQIWKDLDTHLSKSYTHAGGSVLKIACATIDSGDAESQLDVYRFVKPRQIRRIFAIKGSSVPNAPIIASVKQSKKVRVMLHTIGTDTAKTTIYGRLKIETPGPRYLHFPQGFGFDEEHFHQLTAESVSTTLSRGFPKRVWKKNRDRNEGLDLAVYNLAAKEILNPNMKVLHDLLMKNYLAPAPREYQLKASGDGGAEDAAPPAAAQPPAPGPATRPAQKRPRRKISFGGGGLGFGNSWNK